MTNSCPIMFYIYEKNVHCCNIVCILKKYTYQLFQVNVKDISLVIEEVMNPTISPNYII